MQGKNKAKFKAVLWLPHTFSERTGVEPHIPEDIFTVDLENQQSFRCAPVSVIGTTPTEIEAPSYSEG